MRALVGLSYPSDPEIVARLEGGEQIPEDERGNRTVEAGDVVQDIPESSIKWLLKQGLIEDAAKAAPVEPSAKEGD
jgi:hypothetical protein